MIRMERRADAPAALDPTKPDSYRDPSVYQALAEDFAGKCYLCETPRRAAQIEHFRPKADFPELRTTWTNLFLACGGSCNQRRVHWPKDTLGKRWPAEGLLDPSTDDIETRLQQGFTWASHEDIVLVAFSATDPTDGAARNTATELNRIHDEHERGREIRIKITDTINRVCRELAALLNPDRAFEARLRLRAMVQRRAPHAGIVRHYLRAHLAKRPDLLEEFGLA